MAGDGGILAPLPGLDRRPPKTKCVNHFLSKMVSQLGWTHMYGYVENDPINAFDLLGLADDDDFPNLPTGTLRDEILLGAQQLKAQESGLMAQAVNKALTANHQQNISSASSLSPTDALLSRGPGLLGKKNCPSSSPWTSVPNTHGADAYEEMIPNSPYVLKIYLKDQFYNNQDSATISQPTYSFSHIADTVDYIEIQLSGINPIYLADPNQQHAQMLLGR